MYILSIKPSNYLKPFKNGLTAKLLRIKILSHHRYTEMWWWGWLIHFTFFVKFSHQEKFVFSGKKLLQRDQEVKLYQSKLFGHSVRKWKKNFRGTVPYPTYRSCRDDKNFGLPGYKNHLCSRPVNNYSLSRDAETTDLDSTVRKMSFNGRGRTSQCSWKTQSTLLYLRIFE